MKKYVSKLLLVLATVILVLSSSMDVMAAGTQKISKLQVGLWKGNKFQTVSKTELYVNGESAAVIPEVAGAAVVKNPKTIVLDVNALVGKTRGGEYVVSSDNRSVARVVRLSHDVNNENYYKIQITAADTTGQAVIQVRDKYNLKKTAKLTVTVKSLAEEIDFGSNVIRKNDELQMVVAKKGKNSLGAVTDEKATNKKLKFTVVEEHIGSAGNFSATPTGKGTVISVNAKGMVTGKNTGWALVKVSAQDQKYVNGNKTVKTGVSRMVKIYVQDSFVSSVVIGNPGLNEKGTYDTIKLKGNATSGEKTFQLEAEAYDGKGNLCDSNVISFTSSKPSVAKVDANGLITAVGNGTAKISVVPADGSKLKKAVSINVLVTTDAEQINLPSDDITVLMGKSYKVNASVDKNASNKKLEYLEPICMAEDGTASATITVNSSGVIKGICPGKAVLAIQSKDGAVKRNVKVTVLDPVGSITANVPVYKGSTKKSTTTTLYLNKNQGNAFGDCTIQTSIVSAGGRSYQLSDGKIKLTSDKPSVATVDQNGLITAVGKGTAVITLASTDGSNKKATIRVKVVQMVETILVNGAAGGKIYIADNNTVQLKATTNANASNKNVAFRFVPESAYESRVTLKGNKLTVKNVAAEGNVKVGTLTVGAKDATNLPLQEAFDTTVDIYVVGEKKYVTDEMLKFKHGYAVKKGETSDALQLDIQMDDDVTERTLIWKSDNTKLVAVDQMGMITAKSEGVATITVSDKAGRATASTKVRVGCSQKDYKLGMNEEMKLFINSEELLGIGVDSNFDEDEEEIDIVLLELASDVGGDRAVKDKIKDVFTIFFHAFNNPGLKSVELYDVEHDVTWSVRKEDGRLLVYKDDTQMADNSEADLSTTVAAFAEALCGVNGTKADWNGKQFLLKMEKEDREEGYNSLCYTVDYDVTFSVNNVETPGDGTEIPGDGTETPGDGTEIPGDGTETPGDGTETPGDGTETPGDGAETPGDGTETPDEDSKFEMELIFTKGDSWGNGMIYNIAVRNLASESVSDWEATVTVASDVVLNDCWNCNCTISGTTMTLSGKYVNESYDTSVVPGKGTIEGMGISINTGSALPIGEYIIKVGNVSAGSGSGETDGGSGDGDDEGTTPSPEEPVEEVKPEIGSPFENHGKLKVSGTQIVDKNGEAYRLCGVSTHGLAWYPQYVNKDTFQYFRDDWGANVIRLAMYTDEYGGYLNGGDKTQLETLIDNGVKYATELGMYVIIDWHILATNPGNYTEQAKTFFEKMSSRYANYDNILYEICNEPTGSDWQSVIKPYAEAVLEKIRTYNEDAIVLVGTNTWSQDVDAVVNNKIDDSNVMYVAHFYAATHGESYRNKVITAINGGVPVFISESSVCEASGDGAVGEESAKAWFDLLKENNISYIAWSVSNKNESSALIASSCSKLSGFTVDELSVTGKWYRTRMRSDRGLNDSVN